MAKYLESGLSFSFSSHFWSVRQYDKHTYYRGISSAGYKGADFVGIYKKDRLVIIEVKNYASSWTTPPDKEKIVDEIHRKTEDTLIGLDAIRQMLERKWLYRNISFLLSYLPATDYDWPFWFKVSNLLRNKSRISLLLILAGIPERLKNEVAVKLRRELTYDVGTVHLFSKVSTIYEGLNIEIVGAD